MNRIISLFSFSIACVLGAACAEESAVICEVVWSANDMEVGRATITYDGMEDVDAALDLCFEDQADHEERPDAATMHNCSCSN
jgi:hypothetical protein